MHTNEIDSWYTALSDYFNINITAEKRNRWFSMLRSRFEGLTESELIEIIHRQAPSHPDNYGRPTIKNIIQWVRNDRDQNDDCYKEERYLPDCAICNRGWIHFYPDVDRDATYEHFVMSRIYDVPCVCTKGEALFDSVIGLRGSSAEFMEKLRKIRQMAKDQHGRREVARLKAHQEIMGAKVPAGPKPPTSIFKQVKAENPQSPNFWRFE
jgi:hypothetical protein